MKKQFKAESKKLLDLMIHSIYTHKEIFLRELISNSSDAIDKLHFNSLSDSSIKISKDDLEISISIDKENRILTISDNGIGMSKDELEENLGTIAKSGSLDFKKTVENNEDIDIIGQFGVGFYSAFMVADKLEVISKPYSGEAYKWMSSGDDGYTVEKSSRNSNGTTINVYIRQNTEEDNYDEYLEGYRIRELIKKYSDYVRYPIKMDVEKVEDEKAVIETEVLNSMIPLWKKRKSEITEEEYNDFYKSQFHDFTNPQKIIHTNAEGTVSFNAIIYIPSSVPMNFYQQNSTTSFKLYSKGVFIMDEYKELIPEYFKFAKGLVDTDDVNLNISREVLQNNHKLKLISKNIENKIKTELEKMLKNERDEYEKFFDNFGLQLKYGCYSDFGMHKEKVQDLLLFKSSFEDKYTTLQEYVSRMHEDQTDIYFVSGKDIEKIKVIPQLEKIQDKYEVLYFTDEIDEFLVQIIMSYQDKNFKSITQGDLDIDESENIEELKTENQELLNNIKEALNDNVAEVKLSSRLVSHPVCLISGDGLSFEMEKVLSAMPNSAEVKATKILEINPDHEIFNKLQKLDKDEITKYSKILYNQALLLEGLPLEDPVEFSILLSELMSK
ncbi:MAG: molecular chaperone HtpG [Bacilli bacterium]